MPVYAGPSATPPRLISFLYRRVAALNLPFSPSTGSSSRIAAISSSSERSSARAPAEPPPPLFVVAEPESSSFDILSAASTAATLGSLLASPYVSA